MYQEVADRGIVIIKFIDGIIIDLKYGNNLTEKLKYTIDNREIESILAYYQGKDFMTSKIIE